MKRILWLILIFGILVSAAACDTSAEHPTETTKSQTVATSAVTTVPTEASTTVTTAPPQPPVDVPSEPSVETTEPTEPMEQPDVPIEPANCDHSFQTTSEKQSTCTTSGYVVSTCTLCGLCETVDLAPSGHIMMAATCTSPKICSICGATDGSPLGHRYANGKCTVCGKTIPDHDNPTPSCAHVFKVTAQTSPTCVSKGGITYTCGKCANTYAETIPETGHSYTEATCLMPKVCSACQNVMGKPLGHDYGSDYLCNRCGAMDPNKPVEPVDFTVTIRNKSGNTVGDVTVTVYVDDSAKPAGNATTEANGKAVIHLMPGSSYKVVLSNLPSGYECKESYTFRSLTTNITLSTIPIMTPNDHSKAQYKVGSTMGDFTLTDTDGISYTLSELLKSKNAVILNFWYVNCSPCKAEFPYFEEAYKLYSDDIQLLTMSHLDTEEQIRSLRAEMGMTFPMIRENIGFREGFGLTAYPTTVVIGKGGKILMIHTGSYKRDQVLSLFATYAK